MKRLGDPYLSFGSGGDGGVVTMSRLRHRHPVANQRRRPPSLLRPYVVDGAESSSGPQRPQLERL